MGLFADWIEYWTRGDDVIVTRAMMAGGSKWTPIPPTALPEVRRDAPVPGTPFDDQDTQPLPIPLPPAYITDLERIIYECVRLSSIMLMADGRRLEVIYNDITKRYDALLPPWPPADSEGTNE